MIGKTFLEHIENESVLVIGSTRWSRQRMIEDLGCANFIAAARITKHLEKLGVTTLDKLNAFDPASFYRIKGIGDTQVYVLMCVLDANGYSVSKWWGWSEKENRVTFSTHKHRVKTRASKRKSAA